MDGKMKFYLLAELSGWNCQAYLKDERKKVQESESLSILKDNVRKAKGHLSGKAREVVRSYENLRIDPKTIYQAFLIENSIDYLALHSFPEYYINPLAIDPDYEGEITSIGDLVFECAGEEKPLNDIILDENIGDREKKEAVSRQLDYYLLDMEQIVSRSIARVKKEAFRPKSDMVSAITRFLEVLFFVLANFFLFVIYIVPFEAFHSFLGQPDPKYLMTYVLYVYPVVIYVFDIVFVLFQSYRARLRESFDYARRFLAKNADTIYETIRETRDDLYDYICGAINNRMALLGDIKDFSRLKDAYIDLRSVLLFDNLKKKRTYLLSKGLLLMMTTIAVIAFAFSFIVYLLGAIFGVAL